MAAHVNLCVLLTMLVNRNIMQAAVSFVKQGKKVYGSYIYISNPIKNLTSFTGTRQIVAIGRNYADHVKELRNSIPKEPFFFLKPTTSYLVSGGTVEIPRGIIAHHEGTL